MRVRTGVNTGQVVTGTDERLATGDAVNLAARLEQAAAPGEIVMGPETWRLVRDAVSAEPLEPLRLKGKSQPVAAYRLLRVRRDAARAAAVPGRRWWAATVSCGCSATPSQMWWGTSCGLFTVLGMAGVGKSRLHRSSCAASMPGS